MSCNVSYLKLVDTLHLDHNGISFVVASDGAGAPPPTPKAPEAPKSPLEKVTSQQEERANAMQMWLVLSAVLFGFGVSWWWLGLVFATSCSIGWVRGRWQRASLEAGPKPLAALEAELDSSLQAELDAENEALDAELFEAEKGRVRALVLPHADPT